jgi:hypothetical protein
MIVTTSEPTVRLTDPAEMKNLRGATAAAAPASDGASAAAAPMLDDATGASIDLAVAQWMRSPRATSLARERLRAMGVSETEIEERRRCRSADQRLAAILRLAVTFVIARGRLEVRDRALLPATDRDATIAAIAQATSLAFLRVSLANEVAANEPYPAIDVNIGDY